MNPLRKLGSFCGIFFLFALVTVRSEADDLHTVMADPGTVTSNTAPANPLPSDYGFDFTVGSQSLLVSDFGMFDFNGDGLANSHTIKLWDMNTNLIAFSSIPAGIDAVLLNGFRYEPLTNEVMLLAGKKYFLMAAFGSDFAPGDPDRSYTNTSAATFDSEIIPGEERKSGPGIGVFAVVSSPFGPLPGPNAMFTVVPEPSFFGLVIAGGLGLLGARRRGTKKPYIHAPA